MDHIWTKSFTLMTAGTFSLFIAFYMLYPTLPLFITEIGGTEADAGLAMGAFMLTAVVFRPFIGGLLDRIGRRPFVIGGVLLFALAMYLYTWAGGIVVLLWLRVMHGTSWAISTTAIQTAVTDMIPPDRRGEGLGWFGMSMTVAMAIGPLLGLAIAQNLSYPALFLCAVGLSLAALGAMLGAHIPFRPQGGARRMEIFEPSVLPVVIAVFFLFVAYGGITTFVPLFAGTIGVNSGLFFLAYAATLFVTRPVAGRLSDGRGETFILVPSLIVTVVALLTLSVSSGLPGFVFAAVPYGIGFGSAMPVLQATTIRLAHPNRIGVANASFATATDLGIGLGAIVLGWVSQYGSHQAVFVTSAASVALSLLIFMLVVQRVIRHATHESISSHTLAETR